MPSTASARELGRRGERLAATYLEERGWKVVGTGFLAPEFLHDALHWFEGLFAGGGAHH